MLTMQDCIELSHFTEDEIGVIAEHEHVPEIVAIEIGEYLMSVEAGEQRIASIIRDGIETARRTGHIAHAAKLRFVLKHYLKAHPQAS